MGVFIGKSTKIVDRETGEVMYGEVPAGSVVVAGRCRRRGDQPLLRGDREEGRCADPVKDLDQRFAEGLMIMRAAIILASLIATTIPAAAGPFDGVYRPDGATSWDCTAIGSDGGALAVRDDVFYGVESACQLTNPVAVNGMSAVLYVQCSSEGENGRMPKAHDADAGAGGGLAVIRTVS
jgi:hypothetical protein